MTVKIHVAKPAGVRRSKYEAWAEMWIMVWCDGGPGAVWIITGNTSMRVGAVL